MMMVLFQWKTQLLKGSVFSMKEEEIWERITGWPCCCCWLLNDHHHYGWNRPAQYLIVMNPCEKIHIQLQFKNDNDTETLRIVKVKVIWTRLQEERGGKVRKAMAILSVLTHTIKHHCLGMTCSLYHRHQHHCSSSDQLMDEKGVFREKEKLRENHHSHTWFILNLTSSFSHEREKKSE